MNLNFQNRQFPKIAIIGAGLAGLTASYRLKQSNLDFDIYEAKGRVGGRVFTVKIDEKPIELGGENLKDGGPAQNIKVLIDELGLETFSHFQKMNPILFCAGGNYSLASLLKTHAFKPFSLNKKLSELAITSQNMQEVIDRLIPSDDPLNLFCQKIISAYEGAEPKKITSHCYQTLYHFLLGGLSAVHPKNGANNEETEIEFEEIKGGNYLLPKKLMEKVKDNLHLNHPLKRLSKNEKGKYILEFEGREKQEADIVILTVPAAVLRDIEISEFILPKSRKQKMEATLYGNPAKIFFAKGSHKIVNQFFCHESFFYRYKETPHDSFCLFFIDPHGFFQKETIANKYYHSLREMGYIDHSLVSQKICYADEIPMKNYNCSVGYSWQNDPYIRGSYSSTAVENEFNHCTTIQVGNETIQALYAPVNQSLYFAGEHTTTMHDILGTMEAAVESGEKVARMLKQAIAIKG